MGHSADPSSLRWGAFAALDYDSRNFRPAVCEMPLELLVCARTFAQEEVAVIGVAASAVEGLKSLDVRASTGLGDYRLVCAPGYFGGAERHCVECCGEYGMVLCNLLRASDRTDARP